MGVRLINIFGELYNPLDISKISSEEAIATNYGYVFRLLNFDSEDPGNWILPESMDALFYVTFCRQGGHEEPREIVLRKPFPTALIKALESARATELKKDWLRRIDPQQVADLRRTVQGHFPVAEMDRAYNDLRLKVAEACAQARQDWLEAMAAIPIYMYPPDARFKLVPVDDSTA